jgi:hypothetical protein
LSTKNPIWLDLSSNSGRRRGKPTTNTLSVDLSRIARYGSVGFLILQSPCYRPWS